MCVSLLYLYLHLHVKTPLPSLKMVTTVVASSANIAKGTFQECNFTYASSSDADEKEEVTLILPEASLMSR